MFLPLSVKLSHHVLNSKGVAVTSTLRQAGRRHGFESGWANSVVVSGHLVTARSIIIVLINLNICSAMKIDIDLQVIF